MKTSTIPVSAPKWYIVDAEGQVLGRIAAKIAHMLRGKHKPSFSPHQICGDEIIVINAAKLSFEARKLSQKEYISHTGYIGHLKSEKLKDTLIKYPERVIERAVKGMLPKNRLRDPMLKRLHVFADSEHPHAPQKPVSLTLS